MKTILAFTLLLAVVLAWKSIDVLSDLNLTQKQVEEVAFSEAQKGLYVPEWNQYALYAFVKKARALPAGAQTAAVQSLGTIVKAYVSSDRFKKDWQAYITEQGITDPQATGEIKRLEEARRQDKEQKAMMAKSAKKMDAAQVQMAKTLKEHPEMLDMVKNQMSKEEWAEMEAYLTGQAKMPSASGNNSDDYLTKEEQRVQQAQKAYEDTKYPTMLRNRLTSFIETANSVDFTAQLKAGKYGKKEFVNPAYETKSDVWKLLYRAGKEPTFAALDFAKQWLAELK